MFVWNKNNVFEIIPLSFVVKKKQKTKKPQKRLKLTIKYGTKEMGILFLVPALISVKKQNKTKQKKLTAIYLCMLEVKMKHLCSQSL